MSIELLIRQIVRDEFQKLLSEYQIKPNQSIQSVTTQATQTVSLLDNEPKIPF